MKKRIKKRAAILRYFMLMIFSIASLIPIEIFAIGQTTEPIVITNALRSGEYQQTMIIINTEKTDSVITFAAHGDIEKWAEFYKFNDFSSKLQEISMKPGEVTNISVVFKIPEDSPNGEYKGAVAAVKKPGSSEADKGSSTSVSQEINRAVTINVNDEEFVSFEASVIPKTYDLSEGELLEIRLIYDNRGNTSISPQAQIKIKRDDQAIYNSIFPYPENMPQVKPGAVFEIPSIQIPTGNFEKGRYRAEMSFLINGKTTYEKQFGFTVGMMVSKDQGGLVLGAKNGNIIKGINDTNVFVYAMIGLSVIFGILMILKNKHQVSKKASVPNNANRIETSL